MIVQILMVRNELPLIKELLPIWKKYADGFVFLLDTNTDSTLEYLESVSKEYNILDILKYERDQNQEVWIETEQRQQLFDTAFKYTNKIICLDADEYLDGDLTKTELEELLNQSTDTVLHLQWVQYTSVDTVRVDGPWKNNYKDRIGSYSKPCNFVPRQMHSTHLPYPENQLALSPDKLFIAHLQWLNKEHVVIKQYFWKVMDYITSTVYKLSVAGNAAYDASVNNFEWEEEYTYTTLKINPFLLEKNAIYDNYRLKFIKEQTKLHNIPNLGDWGYNILNIDETKPYSGNPYKVSVITAVGPSNLYERFFERYLENVKDQHFFNQTEHIIVYSEWYNAFNKLVHYPNFKLIKEDEQKGVYNAWNIGIKAATTSYVTNWNVDDLRHPLNIKVKYDVLEKNDCDVAYNWYTATLDETENFYNIDIKTRPFLAYPDNYENYVMDACCAGPDPVWKKSLHDKVGYFDYENFNTIGDWEMWIRFAKAEAKFRLIPEVLCLYLDHAQTVSQRQGDKVTAEKQRLYEKYK